MVDPQWLDTREARLWQAYRDTYRELMRALEATARTHGITLLWLTTHEGTPACAFYEALGYTFLGVMPDYSQRPDGELWPSAFYYRQLGDD